MKSGLWLISAGVVAAILIPITFVLVLAPPGSDFSSRHLYRLNNADQAECRAELRSCGMYLYDCAGTSHTYWCQTNLEQAD